MDMGHVQKIVALIFVLAAWAAGLRADDRHPDEQRSVLSPQQPGTADQRAQAEAKRKNRRRTRRREREQRDRNKWDGNKKAQPVSTLAAHGRQSTSYSARLAFAVGHYLRAPQAGVPLRRFSISLSPVVTGSINLVENKGLEFIASPRTQILLGVPAYTLQSPNGPPAGFGDLPLQLKFRIASAEPHEGNYLLTFILSASVPTGAHRYGAGDAVLTPTLAAGKGWGNSMCSPHLERLCRRKHRQARPATPMEYRFPIPRGLETLAGTGSQRHLL